MAMTGLGYMILYKLHQYRCINYINIGKTAAVTGLVSGEFPGRDEWAGGEVSDSHVSGHSASGTDGSTGGKWSALLSNSYHNYGYTHAIYSRLLIVIMNFKWSALLL